MKHLVILFLMFGFMNNIQAQEPSNKIIGIWLDEEKTNKIEIYKSGNAYSGKIVWLEQLETNPNLQLKDKKNPNRELRNRDILGINIITGLQYKNGKWVNGTIYAPKRGMYADCKVELLSNGQLKIIVSKSGYTKTQKWTRN